MNIGMKNSRRWVWKGKLEFSYGVLFEYQERVIILNSVKKQNKTKNPKQTMFGVFVQNNERAEMCFRKIKLSQRM